MPIITTVCRCERRERYAPSLCRDERPGVFKCGFVGQAGNAIECGNLDEAIHASGAVRVHLHNAIATAVGDLYEISSAESTKSATVKTALRWLENTRMAREVRAIAAIFVAKHSSPTRKRTVRLAYENEPSAFVRSAFLYASRYFTLPERRTYEKARGAHNLVNTLITQAI